jgi:hypothetical protein
MAHTSSTPRASALLLNITFRGKPGESGNHNSKGPLGLTTVYRPRVPALAELVFVHGLGGGPK